MTECVVLLQVYDVEDRLTHNFKAYEQWIENITQQLLPSNKFSLLLFMLNKRAEQTRHYFKNELHYCLSTLESLFLENMYIQ